MYCSYYENVQPVALTTTTFARRSHELGNDFETILIVYSCKTTIFAMISCPVKPTYSEQQQWFL